MRSSSKKATPASPSLHPTIGVAALRGDGSELEFRDFMAELFAAATTLQLLRRRVAKSFDLSSSELAILLAVGKLGPRQTIRELAEHLEVSASNVTSDIKTLVDKRYLLKRPHPSDSRAICIELTRSGTGLIGRLSPELQRVNDRVFADLSRSDMKKITTIMSGIVLEGRKILVEDSPNSRTLARPRGGA